MVQLFFIRYLWHDNTAYILIKNAHCVHISIFYFYQASIKFTSILQGTSQALGQSYDCPIWLHCPSASKTAMNISHGYTRVDNITLISSPPGQNGCHFGRRYLMCIFLNENDRIQMQISLKFVPRSPIVNKPAFVQVMAWCWIGDKPLPEPMMAQFTDALA